jgi:hypothetical protein
MLGYLYSFVETLPSINTKKCDIKTKFALRIWTFGDVTLHNKVQLGRNVLEEAIAFTFRSRIVTPTLLL